MNKLSIPALTLSVATLTPALLQAKEKKDTITNLEEIVITEQSARQRIANARLGSETLDLKLMNAAPVLFGEADIVKTLALMPGVRAENEGMGGFEVRGGSSYENLISLDGMTLYNPSHMMGIFSTFNNDAIGHAVLHKGPIPANFGGAASSVLETSVKPGDMTRYHGTATIGLLSSKAAFEGPLVKDKLSLAVAARRSYADLVIGLHPDYKDNKGYFYDVNAKLRWKIGRGNTLDISGFRASDNNDMSGLMYIKWGNSAGNLNWNLRASDNLSFITNASATHYDADLSQTLMDMKQRVVMYIHDYSATERAIWNLSNNHTLEFGARTGYYGVQSGEMQVNSQTLRQRRAAWENAVWMAFDARVAPRISVSAGLRFSSFNSLNGKYSEFVSPDEPMPDHSFKRYQSLEPRMSAKYELSELHNIKAGYSITTQPLHFLRTSFSSFPFDRVAISSPSVKQEKAYQYSASYAGMVEDGAWDWSIEGYYKNLENVYDYRDGYSVFSRVNLESIILAGKGRSYGLEVILRRNIGRFTGWVAYTLSKTESKIAGINNDEWYRASNDRRHDVSIVGACSVNDKWSLTGSWTYLSGKPLTAPAGKYLIDGQVCFYYSGRNTYQTPPSHRLDITATYSKTYKHFSSQLAFGVYNVYARQNPFIVYFESDPSNPDRIVAKQLSLFAFLPSVSYTIKF